MSKRLVVAPFLCMLVLFLAGCGASVVMSKPSATPTATKIPTVTPTRPATKTPTVTPTRPATKIPTVTPTRPATKIPTVTPTPTSDLKTLLPNAASLCEAAFAVPTIQAPISVPLMRLERAVFSGGTGASDSEQWKVSRFIPFIGTRYAAEVQGLLCVHEIWKTVGKYTSGVPADQRDFDVRVVRWPTGDVLAAAAFRGGAPPGVTRLITFGEAPESELLRWLLMDLGLGKGAQQFVYPGMVLAADLARDRTVVAASGGAGQAIASPRRGLVMLWNVATGKERIAFEMPCSEVESISLAPDGLTVAVSCYDGQVKLWDSISGKELRTFSEKGKPVFGVDISPDGKLLATASEDTTVKLYDLTTGKIVRTLTAHTAAVNRAVFSPDGTILASGGKDGLIRLWDVTTGQELRTVSQIEVVTNLLFGGKKPTPSPAKTLEYLAEVRDLSFSTDGTVLVAAGACPSVWQVHTGELLQVIRVPMIAEAIAVSPDRQSLALGGNYANPIVSLWDIATGQEVRQLVGHDSDIETIIFVADGGALLSASRDGIVNLWDITKER